MAMNNKQIAGKFKLIENSTAGQLAKQRAMADLVRDSFEPDSKMKQIPFEEFIDGNSTTD